MSIDAAFDKYDQDGAYHWELLDPSFGNARFNPPLVARYQALIDLLPPAPHAILDVGSGDGCLLHRIGQARPNASLHGLEPVRGAVALAQERLTRLRTEACITEGSAYALPFADASFDVLVMADVIEHLKEPEQALLEAHRVLDVGGVLLLSTPHRQPDFTWDAAHHAHEYESRELEQVLSQHFDHVLMSACSPMAWMRLWRAHSALRVGLRHLSRLGFDPIAKTDTRASVAYGQIIARCERRH